VIEKIKGIFNSVRFWGFVLGESGIWIGKVATDGFTYQGLLTLISVILLTAAGIGSVDKWAKK